MGGRQYKEFGDNCSTATKFQFIIFVQVAQRNLQVGLINRMHGNQIENCRKSNLPSKGIHQLQPLDPLECGSTMPLNIWRKLF